MDPKHIRRPAEGSVRGRQERSLVRPAGRHHTARVRRWSLLLLAFVGCEAAPPWWARTPKQREVAPAVLFVALATLQSASADGTQSRPFPSVAEAVKAAPAGALVRIAEGTFAETLVLDKAVTLAGAGSGKTRLVAPPGTRGPIVRVQGEARVEVRDLAIANGAVGISAMGGSARLQGVALRDLSDSALVVRGAEVAFVDGEIAAVGGGKTGVAVRIDKGSFEMRRSTMRR